MAEMAGYFGGRRNQTWNGAREWPDEHASEKCDFYVFRILIFSAVSSRLCVISADSNHVSNAVNNCFSCVYACHFKL